MAAFCQTANAGVAVKSHEQWGRLRWLTPRPTLEQIAYHYWGAPLEAACPNGSLHFAISRKMPAEVVDVGDATPEGVSWGDCRPWVQRDRRPMMCYVALHEAGHERGLDHSTDGGVMDPEHQVLASFGLVHLRGRVVHRQEWTGLPNVCRPGYRIPG